MTQPWEADIDKPWSVKQLSEEIGVSEASIRGALRSKRIPGAKVLKEWKIPGAVARAIVSGRDPGKRPELEKVPTQDLVAELEARQDREMAVIVSGDRGLEVDGKAFRQSVHGDYYRRQINIHLNEAKKEAETNPQKPLGIDPPQVFKIAARII